MNTPIRERYRQRLARYTTALRNEQPDRVPIRPFVAEWVGRYAGYTCQELAHDYTKAHDAVLRCAIDFDWDAMVPNMIATWTGMLQALGLEYYAIPGLDLPPHVGHQYREPPVECAYMRSDEYDQLIDDPTYYLYNVWWPRVARPLSAVGEPVTFQHNLALVKGILAMDRFLADLGVQATRLREEAGTVPAIAGMLRAPLDILADKLRGYVGLVDDLHQQPRKVLAACEALMPHLAHFALATADPDRHVPLGFWMHRGCVPFVSFDQFRDLFWATLKPIVEQLWTHGHQTLFYAEGNWNHHLRAFAELPERSIVFHMDQSDPAEAHRVLGDRFCLSGGIPNLLLARGSPEQVRNHCRQILHTIGRDGGYILDASAIIQNDARVENLRAMTDAVGEYGVYNRGHSTALAEPVARGHTLAEPVARSHTLAEPVARSHTLAEPVARGHTLAEPVAHSHTRGAPGACVPWSQVRESFGTIPGDEAICREVWDRIDAMANMFIWTLFLVF